MSDMMQNSRAHAGSGRACGFAVWGLQLLLALASCVLVTVMGEDRGESMSYYKNMELRILSPHEGETVWNRDLAMLVVAITPDQEEVSFNNRRGWNMTIEIRSAMGSYHYMPHFPAYRLVQSQPVGLPKDSFRSGEVAPTPGNVTLTVSVTQVGRSDNSVSFSAQAAVTVNYQPLAPLPMPAYGDGEGLVLVSPSLSQGDTPSGSVHSLGMSCYYLNSNTPCGLTAFAKHAQQSMALHRKNGNRSPQVATACDVNIPDKQYVFNDLSRSLSRDLCLKHGEKVQVLISENSVSSQPSDAAWPRGIRTTAPCALNAAPFLEACHFCVASVPTRMFMLCNPGYPLELGRCGFQWDYGLDICDACVCISQAKLAQAKQLRDALIAASGISRLLAAEAETVRPQEGKRIGLEVGVQYGHFTHMLLQTWQTVEIMYGVDEWAPQHGSNQDYMFQEASRRLHPSGKVFLIRGVSPDIAARFPNGSLDFIYIDAKHDYSSVLADLLAFWPKLPPGGILAGHDFQDFGKEVDGSNDWMVQPDGTRHLENKAVSGAVLDFAQIVKRQLSITYEERKFRTWMLRR